MSKFSVGDKVRFIREEPYTTSEGNIERGQEGVVVALRAFVIVDFKHVKNTHMEDRELELVTGSYLDSLAIQYKLLHVKWAQIQDREAALVKERQSVNDQIDKLGDQILEACRSVK